MVNKRHNRAPFNYQPFFVFAAVLGVAMLGYAGYLETMADTQHAIAADYRLSSFVQALKLQSMSEANASGVTQIAAVGGVLAAAGIAGALLTRRRY